jgi:hypothetical protein
MRNRKRELRVSVFATLLLSVVVGVSACTDRVVSRCGGGTSPDTDFVRTFVAAACARYYCDDMREIDRANQTAARMGYCK